MRGLWVALAALLALVGAAEARQHYPARGHRIVPAAQAPLDGFTQPSGAYSFRKLRSAYAGPAMRLRRASDNAELDIGFLGYTSFTGAPWDGAAANAHCAATSCTIKTLYDQSGNARDWAQTVPATEMPLLFNCVGSLPCWVLSDATTAYGAGGANITPATGVVSLNAVFKRVVNTGQCVILRENGTANNRLTTRGGAGGVSLSSAVGTIFTVLAENTWHSVVGVINGATSTVTGDTGTPGSGSVTGNTTLGAPGIVGTAGTTCHGTEAIFWDNYVLSAGETTALIANQRSYGLIP